MDKKFKTIFTTVLTLCMIVSFCVVPMTANAEAPQDETYEAYDEITYDKLKDANGNFLSETGTTLAGGTTLTYNRTSPTGSAILKYRWTVGTGTVDGFTGAELNLSFEEVEGNAAYMFSALFSASTVNFRPYYDANNFKNLSKTLVSGSVHDIEFAKLKVKTGANTGKYYVYLKIDGEIIGESYTNIGDIEANGDYTTRPREVKRSVLSNKIFIACHGVSGTKISATPEEEIYDTVDEITLSDLGLNPGNFENALPGTASTYTATSSSYSYVLKFYWRANLKLGTEEELCVSPDGQWFHGKGLWFRGQNFLFGYPDGPKTILSAITSGDHLIEFGRKKVLSGTNQGNYYVYVKVDDALLADGYIEYATANNTIWIRGNAIDKQRFSDFEYPETYEDYVGDFDGNGIINAADLAMLRKILLGIEDTSEMPEGIADFNNDGAVDLRDLVAMKKYIADIENLTTLEMISLQIGANPTERTVVWCSNSTESGKVQLALKSDMTGSSFPPKMQEFNATLSDTVTSGKKTNTAKITGLSENTEYVYRVVNGSKRSQIYSFKTQSFTGGTFSFLAVGDSQLGIINLATETNVWADTIAKGLNKQSDASFMISLGDQVNVSNNEAQYDAFFSPDILKSVTLATVVGNHDFSAVNYSTHFKMPNVSSLGVSSASGSGSGDYWYVYDNVLFMSLNSNNTNATEHEQFMTAAISANPNVRWKVVTMHHTLYSVGHGIEATPDAIIALRNNFAPMFSRLGIDVVLSAHDHSYSRTYMMNGTTPVVPEDAVPSSVTNPDKGQVLYVSLNSSSGSMFLGLANGDYPYSAVKSGENVPNISVVDISDNSFKITTYRTTDMSIVDEFTIYKGIN